MKRLLFIGTLLMGYLVSQAQNIREFQVDTATFKSELTRFTGSSLQSDEVPDFQRFLQVFDSLPYERQLDVIEVSNLMLVRKCRPRPHFITYQRVLIQFFTEDKTDRGYDEWEEGYRLFLRSDEALLRNVSQWLSLSLSLLKDNIFYESASITWKISTPAYRFETVESLRVVFDDVTIACYSGMDFIQIMNASGYIDPLSLVWVGQGGRVTWDRVGIPEDELYALLTQYNINLKRPEYSCDSAFLYYPAISSERVAGRLEDKVTVIKNLRLAKYPQFISYRSNNRVSDFVPGINFTGGLSLEGGTLVGSAAEGQPAMLEIYSQDTLRIRARSDRILMDHVQIRAPETEVSIYFGQDSIFHPELDFSYDVADDLLRLNKSDRFTSKGPYSNSYHNMDMNFDELRWQRGESVMKFQSLAGSAIGRGTFESISFFNYSFYMDLQGMDYVHPLAQLAAYSKLMRGRTFHSTAYAQYIGFAEYQVKHQLMSLAMLGFVYYDDETGMITLRQKLFDYIEASMRKRDYDVIRFNSRVEGTTNAELDLSTRDMTIHGIPVIFLSDSQNVRLVPAENSIIMKRNRSFQFDGVVDAGLFRFTGHNFFFQYDSFKIALQDIDSLQLSIPSGRRNEYGEQILTRIDNAIENMTGELLIDHPDNKSGLEQFPEYPTFTSRENSFIFFDNPEIQNGVYDRTTFYFELEPFTIDSLDNFRPAAIAPEGTFYSAGVLPPLEMEMTLRQDNSLGFYMQAPEEGIDLYGGMGRFYNDIEMSSRGLHGYGSLDYLTSTTWSDDFLMHPDSLMTRSRRFLIREKAEAISFPLVENTETDVKLIPSRDLMIVSQVEKAFQMFGDSVFHSGNLALRPGGLSGDGVTALTEARLESDLFSYGARTIAADSAGVKLKKSSFGEFAFLTDDVRALIDLDSRTGQFNSLGDQTRIELPYNLYETNLDQMTWYMDEGMVGLKQGKVLPENTVDIGIDSLRTNGPVYTSLHPRQDGLHFTAPEATYDYRSRQLHAQGVPFIEVADAFVFPDSGLVDIGYQASMNLLENARILANQFNRRHLMYNASVAVNGARDYAGQGYYNYRDAYGNDYRIWFERIWVDTTMVSQAKGTVGEEDPFMLSPFFDFRGEVELVATRNNLVFDGGTRLEHVCDISKGWLRFTSEIDPADIRIPVPEQMMNTDLNRLVAGSLITRDSAHIYSAFLSGRKDYFDANITQAHGVLVHDLERECYLISTEEKLADTTVAGNYLRFETTECRVYGEGNVELTLDFGQVALKTAGNALHDVPGDRFSTRLVMGIDFFFSPDALRVMGSEIDSLPDLQPVDLTRHHYQLAMRDLLGESMARSLERQLVLTGAYEEIPPEWRHTIFFNDLTLTWNQETRSFRYQGNVGIGNIGDIQVNKQVEATIEMVERGSGDVFDIYLRANDDTWYYIAYSPGGLQVLSSNREFNDIVYGLKESDRRVKASLGQAQYIYSLAAQRRLQLFLNRFMEYEDQ